MGPALDEGFGLLASPTGRMIRPLEAIVVDDGSTDDTMDGMTLQVVRVPHVGKGAAVRTAALAAGKHQVIFADADVVTPPDQIPMSWMRARLGLALRVAWDRFRIPFRHRRRGRVDSSSPS